MGGRLNTPLTCPAQSTASPAQQDIWFAKDNATSNPTVNRTNQENRTIDNLFVRGMAAAGAANYMDCVGIHYNEGILPPTATSGDPRGSSNHYSRYYGAMVDVYWRAFGGRRPLCFTELGYLSPEGFPPLPGAFGWAESVTVAQQAAWLDQVVSMAARSGRVRILIIWNVNFTNYDADPMAGFAMIRPDGSCPACAALGS